MYKNFQDGDTSVESFKTHKSFSLTDMDSGSGVFGFSANSSSAHLFSSASAVSSSYLVDLFQLIIHHLQHIMQSQVGLQ